MNRIKCPNCGSTAQPKLVREDHDNYSAEKIKEYICGCGCKFEATFELKEIKMLKAEAS